MPVLTVPPPGWTATRDALHLLADRVIAPARNAVDGDFRLRWLPGGFGTPRFGSDDRQVRIDGTDLVVAVGAQERRAPITTCRAAAEFVGLDASGLPDEPLPVDPLAAAWLSDFYAFTLGLLEDLRREVEAEEPVLWPEHFDYAIVAGDEATGARANYGGSPGDEHHPEAYLYVGPFTPREGELWNARGFSGAELPVGDLCGAEGQRALALAFFRSRMAALEAA